MSLPLSPCSASIRNHAASLGVSALGIAAAMPVERNAAECYKKWIGAGCHAGMEYLDRYHDVREDPRLLLEGAKSVIVCAFNYYPAVRRDKKLPEFAFYSYGADYHEVVRWRLGQLAAMIREKFGGETRVCVDTAPLRERYWAQRAGVGFIGRNNQLIIPGKGSYFFLGEILTTVEFIPDEPCWLSCGDCMACVKSCPGNAILPDGSVDARRCISYLTIEHKGEFEGPLNLGNHIYGCDECQSVCPHNRNAVPADIAEFQPSEAFMSLDREAIEGLTSEKFNSIFRHSAIKRAKLAGLLRNLRHLDSE